MKPEIQLAIISLALLLLLAPILAADEDAPTINLTTEFPVITFEGVEVVIEADIFDVSEIETAEIAYEVDGQVFVEDIQGTEGYNYQWLYVNNDIGQREELRVSILNITAFDEHLNWGAEVYDNTTIIVKKEDVEAPEIEPEAIPLYTESEDHMVIRASVSDPSGVDSVTLHLDDNGSWSSREMGLNNVTGLYEVIVGPFVTDTAVRYYINATDDSANQNHASTLDYENGHMRSFVASFKNRFSGTVLDSSYMQVDSLHRYRMTISRDSLEYQGYQFNFMLSETGVLTGNVTLNRNGSRVHLQDISLQQKSNAIIIDQETKDGVAYDFNLKYITYDPSEPYAEIEINPRQRLVFEGYSVYTYIRKVQEGRPYTFQDQEGGNWQVNVTAQTGYQTATKTFTSTNQFQELFLGENRDIQIFLKGPQQLDEELLKFGADLRIYKFQPPVFEVVSDVPTGSPSGLDEGQIVYNIYADDDLTQVVTAKNTAGSRAYDIQLTATNVTGIVYLVVEEGELTSSRGPVYREKVVGGESVRYYLTQGTLERPFYLNFSSDIDVREAATYDLLLSYTDAHGQEHEVRKPVQFLIYPSRSELEVTKSLSRDPLFIGKDSQASIGVENVGGSPALNVTVVDNTPPNLISDFETWTGDIKPGSSNKVSITYSVKPTTITNPGEASYGFVTVYWKGVCHKSGVRNDAYTLHTEDFYFTALGPHLDFTSFEADRPIVEKEGQDMIFINVGEKVQITATVKNEGNRDAKNISLTFPGFLVESTDFPEGTSVEVGQYFSFTATLVATNEGRYPFQAKITHQDQHAFLGNVYEVYSNYILAQTYLSPVVVQFIDPPSEIAVGETETLSISIRNIGNSPVQNTQVILELSQGLKLEWGTYLIWDGTLDGQQSEIVNIVISGKDFGVNTLTATASGMDIPDVEYSISIEVLSPHVEIERRIDCEYLLAREEFWPRSSEIRSTVTLDLTNIGNDQATNLVVSETLPEGIISFDNLTFGSNLIVWGESGDISLAPNETLRLTYPVWSHTPGHYVYEGAVATYTNPQKNPFESHSEQLDVWVLGNRPFLVQEEPVLVLDEGGAPLQGPVSYNDTVTFQVRVRNIGNQNATDIDLGPWMEGQVGEMDFVMLNEDQVEETIAGGIGPGDPLTISLTFSVLEDVESSQDYDLDVPVSYSDLEGRDYSLVMGSRLEARSTQVMVSFNKSFSRDHVSPGDQPVLEITVTNVGDTDLEDLVPSVDTPDGVAMSSWLGIDLLREGQSGKMVVEFEPVFPPEGKVYQSYQGFATSVQYRSYRGQTTTPRDGEHIVLSVAEPYLRVERSITSPVLLVREPGWPYSEMIMENVTIRVTNSADISASQVNITEELPEGLYTSEDLGSSEITWGGDLVLEPGESVSFTYPVWCFDEGEYSFDKARVDYIDGESHDYISYSQGLEKVNGVGTRPYLVWNGEMSQDPVESITYNDTVLLGIPVKNVGNGKTPELELEGLGSGELLDGWELLNPEEVEETLSGGLSAGSSIDIQLHLRLLRDVTIPGNVPIGLDLNYIDGSENEYSISRTVEIFARPPNIGLSTDISNNHYRLMPEEPGYVNLSVKNVGDAALFSLTPEVECPEDVEVKAIHVIDVLPEGGVGNLSVEFKGVQLGQSVGRTISGINLSVIFTDFREYQHTRPVERLNLTIERPKVTIRGVEAEEKTRLGRTYQMVFTIANDGTYPASQVTIDVGDIKKWMEEISVEGGALNGDSVLLAQSVAPLSESKVTISGKVKEKGEFSVVPGVTYIDGIGSSYNLIPDPVGVKVGEKLIKLIMPFLLWAAVAGVVAGVYYYETRVAEKIKGHQLGSLASSVVTQVEATGVVPPLIPFKSGKLSLAELSHLLSQYLSKADGSGVEKADKTTFIISHPQSRLVPGQDFKNLGVVRDAYMLVADMIQNRVKSSEVVPPTFLVQGFKLGISDIVTLLSLAVVAARKKGRLPKNIKINSSTRVSAGKAKRAQEEEEEEEEESESLVDEPEGQEMPEEEPEKPEMETESAE